MHHAYITIKNRNSGYAKKLKILIMVSIKIIGETAVGLDHINAVDKNLGCWWASLKR